MKNLTNVVPVTPEKKRHPRLGTAYVELAERFVAAFPLGTTVSAKAFDNWGISEGELANPGKASVGDTAWRAHVQDRNDLRRRLNLGGAAHDMPAMSKFQLDVLVQGKEYEVCPLASALSTAASNFPAALKSFVGQKQDRINHLSESIDIYSLTPAVRIELLHMKRRLNSFERRIIVDSESMEAEFADTVELIEAELGLLSLEHSEETGGEEAEYVIASSSEQSPSTPSGDSLSGS